MSINKIQRTSLLRSLISFLWILFITVPIISSCSSKNKIFKEEELSQLNKMPKLDPSITPGGKLDKKLLPKLDPKANWVKIPTWLSGVWQSEDFILYYSQNQNGYVSKERKKFAFYQTQSFGHQKDKEGNIWHCVLIPFATEQDDEHGYIIKQISWNAPVTVSEDEVVMTFHSTNINFQKKSSIVADITKNVSIQTYSQKKKDHILCLINQFGTTSIAGDYRKKTRMHLFKKEDFKPINSQDGFDFKKSFETFITKN